MIHVPERKKIEKKFHPFREDAVRLKQEFESDSISEEVQAKKILKYAPKSLESFTTQPLKDRKFVNALKRVKKTRVLYENYEDFPINQWRLVLQNKFKSVQKFRMGTRKWETLKPYRVFSRMTEVAIFSDWNEIKYVPGMVKLKSLDLCMNHTATDPNLLKKINSMSRTLSSLETTIVHWYQSEEADIPFSSFIKNTNILRCLTHLTLRYMIEDNFSNTFALLPAYCKNLTSLSLFFEDESANLNAMKLLKDFGSLGRVRINSQDLFPFFDHFTFPPFIQDITIELEEKFTVVPLPVQLLEEMLASNQRMIDFSEKWSNLHHLTSLTLRIKLRRHPGNLGASSIIRTFIQKILESIPSLVNFDFELDYPHDYSYEESVDLTNIFAALQRFHDKLQTLRLSLRHSNLSTQLSKQDVTFPKLTKFELSLKTISNLDTIQNIFAAFERPSGENIEIDLPLYVVDSNQALLDLLKVLRKSPRNSKVQFTLGIKVKGLYFGMFDEMFKEFIEKVKQNPVIRNVSLIVLIFDEYCEREIETLRFLKNDIFEEVDFPSLDFA